MVSYYSFYLFHVIQPGHEIINIIQVAVSNILCSVLASCLHENNCSFKWKKNLHYNLSKCLFTAADNWILIAFHSWLIFFLLFHPFINFFGFIYSLILTVSQFNFSEILKMSNQSWLCSVNRTGLKGELGLCQELLYLVSVQIE